MTNAPVSITILPFDESSLKLSVPYDVPTIEMIRQLPKRRWSKQEKCWFIPNDRAAIDHLVRMFGRERIIDRTTGQQECAASAPVPEPSAAKSTVTIEHTVNIPDLIARLERELRVRNYSQRTIQNYCLAVRRFCEDIHADPIAIDQNALKQYIIDLNMVRGFSPRTVNLSTAAINFFYLHVLKISATVESLPRMKVGRSLPEVYSEEEVGRMLSAVENSKHRLILMIAYGCGLRLSEIRNLKPDDLSFDRNLLTVRQGKGRKDRTLMVDEVLLPVIENYLKHGRGKVWMFEGPNPGHRLTARTISLVFEHACYKAEVKRRGGIHGLRHSFATHLMEHGTGIRAIQELLGHGNSKTTEIYTHVSKAMIGKIRSPLANVKIHPLGEKG